MAAFLPDTDSEDELPPAWEERAALDGSVYYVNHINKCTQWTHPRTGKKKIVSGELPSGWERRVDDQGEVSFFDSAHLRTTFTDPRLAFATELVDHSMDIRQRYDGSSTALQILSGMDLSGKTFLITGATNGIGFETARSFAQHGAEVIISGRTETTCRTAMRRILDERPQAKLSILPMDLSSLASVRQAAAQLRTQCQKLDVVILNAGVIGVGWQLTEDGFETVFQVNHLSHFYFILLIESLILRKSRIVVVSSESHRSSSIKSKTLKLETLSPTTASGYSDLMAYNHSKLCNVLHAQELSYRLASRGIDVMALHPGNLISTGITRYACWLRILFALVRPFTKSLQQGAATTVYCAVAPELAGCGFNYFNNCCLTKASDEGRSPDLAAALWDLSLDSLKNKNLPLPPNLLEHS